MTLVYFILIIGIIIAIHELGHMLMAKAFGVYVNEFAIGFGPKLFSKQGKETTYTLRAIPLGGFTGIIENETTPLKTDAEGNPTEILTVEPGRTFYGVSPWKRICILLAGPVFNFILAFMIFIMIFQITGVVNDYPKPYIYKVMAGSPAEAAGIQENDLIRKMEFSDGTSIKPETFYDVIIYNSVNTDPITLTLERNGSEFTVVVTPVYNEESNSYIMGIQSGPMVQRKLTFLTAIPEGIKYGIKNISLTVTSILSLFRSKNGLNNLGGMISIYRYTDEAASYGFESVLSLAGSISVSVGLMNLIPVPVFDGGKIVQTIIEKFKGGRLSPKAEGLLNMVGFGFIIVLFLLVTVLDISRLLK